MPDPLLPPNVALALGDAPPAERPALARTWHLAATADNAPTPSLARQAATWAAIEARLEAPESSGRIDRAARPRARALRRALAWSVLPLLALGAAGGWWAFAPQTILAPTGETRRVALRDGSTVVLASGSALQYRRGRGRHVRLDGEAFFSVARDPRARFRVETARAAVEVLGTAFNVRAWPGAHEATEVTVEHGRVAVTARADRMAAGSAGAAPSVVEAGQSVRFVAGAMPDVRAASGPVGAWRDGAFRLEDRSLAEIFDEVERRFGARVTAPPGVLARRWSLVLHAPVTARDVLEAVCAPNALRYRPTAGGFEVFAP